MRTILPELSLTVVYKRGIFFGGGGVIPLQLRQISTGLAEFFPPFNKAVAVKVSVLGKFSDFLSFFSLLPCVITIRCGLGNRI